MPSDDQHLTDGQLLRRHLEGKPPGGFAELVRRHAGFVYSVAMRQLRDRHLAEDITQAVFLVLVKKAASLQEHQELCGWLFTATMYESRNVLKSRSREARRLEPIARDKSNREATMEHAPWEEVEPHLNEAIEGLNPGERDAVILRYLRRNSYESVGSALGITPAAARQRVHRALERMREFLTGRGVVASVAVLTGGMVAHGIQAAPVGLIASTVEAAGQISAGMLGSKGVIVMASLKAKAVVTALILGSLGMAAGTAAIIAKRKRNTETIYVAPAPPENRSANSSARGGPSPVAPVIRPAFHLVSAASYDGNLGTRTVGGFVGYINKGDWLRYDKVDLGPPGSGQATFTAIVAVPEKYAGNTIEVRQDQLDGPVLATLTIKSTGGHGNWHAQSVLASTYSGGVHDLFLRFSGGGWNLDKFKFAPTSRPGIGPIDAASFTDAKGVHVRDGALCDIAEGHWVRYGGLDFGSGVNALAITYSCEDARAGGTISVRLDQADHPPVAQLTVEGTGGYHRFVSRLVPIEPISGSRDVILSFSGKYRGIANVSRIEFKQILANPSTAPASQASSKQD